MHHALDAFLNQHLRGDTPIPAFEIRFPTAATAHPFASGNLPLLIGMVATVALTSMRLGGRGGVEDGPAREMFEKVLYPTESKHALDSLGKRLAVVGNFDFSFASAFEHFHWYHSFYGLLFPEITEEDRRRLLHRIWSI
jgi:hypothetical protein